MAMRVMTPLVQYILLWNVLSGVSCGPFHEVACSTRRKKSGESSTECIFYHSLLYHNANTVRRWASRQKTFCCTAGLLVRVKKYATDILQFSGVERRVSGQRVFSSGKFGGTAKHYAHYEQGTDVGLDQFLCSVRRLCCLHVTPG